jgi:hypothetical protein
MALGRLWNAFFGKRSETDQTASGQDQSRKVVPAQGNVRLADRPAAERDPASDPGKDARPIFKVKRKAALAKSKKTASSPVLAIADVPQMDATVVKRVPHPKKNNWSKWVTGRSVTTILDTHLGDANRATELLEAIVCDAVPAPKYVAIDRFEMRDGGRSIVQFHQTVRKAGGQAVPIPGTIQDGLRQLSRTLGTVDLVLMDAGQIEWQDVETHRLLSRVVHGGTLMLRHDGNNKWSSVLPETLFGGAARKAA